MKRFLSTTVMVLFLLPQVALGAHQPKILAYVPQMEHILKNGTPAEIQDVLLKNILAQNNILSIQDYMAFLKGKMQYKADEKDIWASPVETFARGFGDCEDLSFLTAAVLRHFGYQPQVLGFREPARSHVFTFVEIDGRFYIFDNTNHVKTTVNSVEDVATFLLKKYNIDLLVEVNQYPRTVKLLYNKIQLMKLVSERS